MKCRVYKNGDKVIYNWPSQKYQDDLSKCKVPDDLKNLPTIVMDDNELPKDKHFIEQLYFDGDIKKENLKVDHNWEVKLMPSFLIKSKHIERLNTKIDEEINKKDPDAVKLIKLQREKEQVKDWDEAKTYQQALVNLQEDGHNKPLIVQKLNAKISELQNKNDE